MDTFWHSAASWNLGISEVLAADRPAVILYRANVYHLETLAGVNFRSQGLNLFLHPHTLESTWLQQGVADMSSS